MNSDPVIIPSSLPAAYGDSFAAPYSLAPTLPAYSGTIATAPSLNTSFIFGFITTLPAVGNLLAIPAAPADAPYVRPLNATGSASIPAVIKGRSLGASHSPDTNPTPASTAVDNRGFFSRSKPYTVLTSLPSSNISRFVKPFLPIPIISDDVAIQCSDGNNPVFS